MRRVTRAGMCLCIGMILAGCQDSDGGSTAAQAALDTAAGTSDSGATLDTATGEDGSADTTGHADTAHPPDSGGAGDTGADTADVSSPGTCATDSAAGLAACIDQARFAADLALVAKARPAGTPDNAVVRDLCASRLAELGYAVERQDFGSGVNVIGVRTGTGQPDQRVVLGAHYDGVPLCDGADDNATGVAGILEAARVLAMAPHARTLVVACWDEEEIGTRGSNSYLRRSVIGGERTVVHFNLEMIGYYSDEVGSQSVPPGFDLIFSDAVTWLQGNDNKGNFIGLVADEGSQKHVDAIAKHANARGLPALPMMLADNLLDVSAFNDLRRSDHAGFWDERIPAIMITDTANFRNSHYHCKAGADGLADVDTERAAKAVAATVGAAAEALAAGDAGEGSTGMPVLCGPDGPACPAGEKCNAVVNGVGKWREQCVPLLPAKVQTGGSECTRPGGEPGRDDCDEGLFCAFWGVPKGSPQKRQCLRLCTKTSDCAAGETCALPSTRSFRSGVCLANCDPFGSDCGAGLACRFFLSRFEDGGPMTTCHWAGSVPEGGACEAIQGYDCQPGLACVLSPVDGVQSCRAYCDAAHPCGAGRKCLPDRNQDPSGDAGFCQPE